MASIKLYSKTRELLINTFVRTRKDDTEGTSRTDLFTYAALMMTGNRTERRAGERSLRAAMKYAQVPVRIHDGVVTHLRTANRSEVADLCKELRPHTEVRKMLEAY